MPMMFVIAEDNDSQKLVNYYIKQNEIMSRERDLINMTEGDNVDVVAKGATYKVPVYGIGNSGLQHDGDMLRIAFVKGSKDPKYNRQDGVICEDLLEMLAKHLTELNVGHFENQETKDAITFIKQAKQKLIDRKRDRAKRGVLSTYKK